MREMILQDRYEIKKVIGRGGFGTTYLAHDNHVDIPVAIKEYLPQRQMSEEEARRETRMAAKFYDLEGVAAARDFFTENDHVYIILEYVDGINIKEYIKKQGRMDGKEALQKMRPVIEAVGKIHEQGVIHRDISADNLMITKEKKIKLIDFGTARFMEDYYDRTYTQNFKHGFTPVEQYRTHETQGPWTDIYALCATIYFMITGIVPDLSVERLIDDKIISLEQIQGTGLSRHQMQCIMKGLEVRPEQRYQEIREFCEDLYREDKEENLSGEDEETAGRDRFFTTGFSTISLFEDIRRSVRKEKKRGRKWIAVSFTAVFFLIAAGAILFMKTETKEKKSSNAGQTKPTAKLYSAAVSQTAVSGNAATEKANTGTALKSEPHYKIGNYVGLNKKKVKTNTKKLREDGLKIIYKEKYSKKAKGTVLSQKPAAGKEYKNLKNVTLTIVLSKGKKPAATVPEPTSTPSARRTPYPKRTSTPKRDSVDFSGNLDNIPE